MKLLSLLISLVIYSTLHGQSKLRSDTNFYENGRIRDIITYKKKTLINHIGFDETGKLIYQSPLLANQRTPSYKFSSGRLYFDSTKLDTLIIGNNIPKANFNVYFPGATVMRIDAYTYFIKSWKPQPKTQKGKMVIDVVENAFFKPKNVCHKVVLIDLN